MAHYIHKSVRALEGIHISVNNLACLDEMYTSVSHDSQQRVVKLLVYTDTGRTALAMALW